MSTPEQQSMKTLVRLLKGLTSVITINPYDKKFAEDLIAFYEAAGQLSAKQMMAGHDLLSKYEGAPKTAAKFLPALGNKRLDDLWGSPVDLHTVYSNLMQLKGVKMGHPKLILDVDGVGRVSFWRVHGIGPYDGPGKFILRLVGEIFGTGYAIGTIGYHGAWAPDPACQLSEDQMQAVEATLLSMEADTWSTVKAFALASQHCPFCAKGLDEEVGNNALKTTWAHAHCAAKTGVSTDDFFG